LQHIQFIDQILTKTYAKGFLSKVKLKTCKNSSFTSLTKQEIHCKCVIHNWKLELF